MTDDTPPPTEWLSRQQLSERWQLPCSTLANWAKTKTGPRFAKFGKYARYRLADVIAWENEQLGAGR